jgi:hypothetical protein
MARIYEHNGSSFFDTGEEPPYEIELNENNFMANLHRDAPLVDRIAITDDRDDLAWSWFRYDQDPEVFNQMVDAAERIGSVLLRSTPFEAVQGIFDQQHTLNDDDFEQLLDDEA